jgi:hypothetical protein
VSGSGQSSAILSSCNSVIACDGQGLIIGSRCSCICENSYGSVIIGGQNLGLSASENNTVYVQCLKIHTVPNCNSLDRLMVYDESDGYVKYRDLSTIPGGGGGGDAIDLNQIAFGTGTGITSSNIFQIDVGNTHLIFGNNTNTNSYNTSIIGGISNQIYQYSHCAVISGGQSNSICYRSYNSSIIAGKYNTIIRSKRSSILGGQCNTLSCISEGSSVIGGFYNLLSCYSYYSSIIGGQCNILSFNNSNSSIIGGFCNSLSCQTNSSSIIGGCNNCICQSNYSAIIGGTALTLNNENNIVYVPELKVEKSQQDDNLTKVLVWDDASTKLMKWRDVNTISGGGGIAPDACQIVFGNNSGTGLTWSSKFTFGFSESNINFGVGHTMSGSIRSSIIGGRANISCSAYDTSIIGGVGNRIIQLSYSSIIGGGANYLCCQSSKSSIIGGYRNTLSCYSNYSSIIGGCYNDNLCSNNSSIIGGCNNCIYQSNCSAIIGGANLVLNSENNIVYVPELKTDTSQQDDNLTKVLVWDDASTKLMKWRDVNTISGGGAINTQTILTYTMSSSDANNIVLMDNISPQTVVIDLNSNVSFSSGTKIDIIQIGTGTVSVSAVGGVTLNSKNSWTSLADQYVAATLLNIGTDDWILIGNLTA